MIDGDIWPIKIVTVFSVQEIVLKAMHMPHRKKCAYNPYSRASF